MIRLFETEWVAGKGINAIPFPRANDVGVKILEEVGRRLIVMNNPTGVVKIASELPVCKSCRSVIAQFEELFPNVKVVVSTGPGKPAGPYS